MARHASSDRRHPPPPEALTHLHDAKLIIGAIDKAAANYIDQLVRATRDQIKHFEQLNDNQG